MVYLKDVVFIVSKVEYLGRIPYLHSSKIKEDLQLKDLLIKNETPNTIETHHQSGCEGGEWKNEILRSPNNPSRLRNDGRLSVIANERLFDFCPDLLSANMSIKDGPPQ